MLSCATVPEQPLTRAAKMLTLKAHVPSSLPPSLGEFETLLLLAILQLSEQGHEAYGSAVRAEIERRAGRAVPRGSIYVTLDRLEDKGLLSSHDGETSAVRGHRPKRLFKVTPAGVRAVRSAVTAVVRMRRGLETLLGRL
jgi:PadR family transcriptional regulator PadR